jgi:hypothetical protein
MEGEWYPIMVRHIEALKKEDVAMEDKMEAAKELAAMAKSESLNEQMSRQNSIVHAGERTTERNRARGMEWVAEQEQYR